MCLVKLFVLGNHALFVLDNQIKFFELLGQEDGLISHNWIDRTQALVHLSVDLRELEESQNLSFLPNDTFSLNSGDLGSHGHLL